MYSYSQYIRENNMSKVHNRVFKDVIRNKTKTNSSKIMDFGTSYEKAKKSVSKYNSLSKIKSSYLNSWSGSVITAPSSTSDTTSSKTNTNNTTTSSSKTESAISQTSTAKDNNLLNVCNGKTFDVSLSYNKKATFTCKNEQVYMTKETGVLSSSDLEKVGKIEQLITSLVHDASGNYVKANFTPKEIKSILSEVGIKPGQFTINSTNGSNKFYLLDSGNLYSNYEVEAERKFYNTTDFVRCFGYSKDAVCTIEGKDYKLDSDGTFNIPNGVVCVPENMTIKK